MPDAPPSVDDAPIACPVCGAHGLCLRFRIASPFLKRRTAYRILRCPRCTHQCAAGPCDDATLAAVYGAAFHASAQQAAAAADSPVVVNARRRVERLAQSGLRGRLLDVGAGTGAFVAAARGAFDAQGVEYSDDAAAAARAAGLRVMTGSFPAQSPAGPFDVITLWDVLSSLRDPHAAIAGVRALLAPGGHALFTVPMASSRVARALGRCWPMLIPPVNLHYFTPRSLERLLQAHGLRIASIRGESKSVAVEFAARKALRSIGLARVERMAAVFPRRWSVRIDLGDIATVHARPAEATP
jgi:SAM-dependent methyltransferase